MKANRVYSKNKISFTDILDPFINGKIEELINSANSKPTDAATKYVTREFE
ncbi:hypothetical protein [Sutcliffiella horikoshii]|uniref:hypothetical protein n=1 Tax=Sutcliffiella horikoshii TaxID=79883 RepID=UPI0012FB8A23|nr:hypothetical protein [Sutcliffiella horikoshii]